MLTFIDICGDLPQALAGTFSEPTRAVFGANVGSSAARAILRHWLGQNQVKLGRVQKGTKRRNVITGIFGRWGRKGKKREDRPAYTKNDRNLHT
jgi:hypothetical protein